jgi:SAM-dependent methyltransferase
MEGHLYDEIFKLEQEHWWFYAKRKIVLSIIQKYLPSNNPKKDLSICDLGCGCGMTLMDISDMGYNAIGLDSNEIALEYCRKRGVRVFPSEISKKIQLPDNSVEGAILLDVLEHIEDEKKVLSEVIRILKPAGITICTVPAYSWLWTKRDNFHHHKRRYQKKELLKLFECFPEFEIVLGSYINSFLFPIALLGRILRKMFPLNSPGDLYIPKFGMNYLLKAIFSSERFIINSNLSFPFGLSILLVARKRNQQSFGKK